jgi:ERCC4-type nuclease
MITKLVRHAIHGLGYELSLRGSGPKSPREAAAFVLEGIPGISASLAGALLARFGSVAGVAAASEDEIRGVPGIGPKTAKKVFSTLHSGQA